MVFFCFRLGSLPIRQKTLQRDHMSGDVLTRILDRVRMNAAIYFDGEFTAPWGIDFPQTSRFSEILSTGSDHIVSYHLFLEGECWAQVEGGELIRLKPGDLVLLPHGEAHKLWNGKPQMYDDAYRAMRRHVKGELRTYRTGRDGDATRVVCGYLGCDRHAASLFLAGLPSLVVVNVRGDEAGHWIESSIRHLVAECASGRGGGGALLARMAEALFVESLRRWVEGLPEEQTGWLAGTRDPIVGRALALIHADVGKAWTMDELARVVGASRSALAERFTRLIGETPLAYLATVRMQTAARLLERTRKTVLQIAADVGYESEAAFNRAFKRQFGEPPARFRRTANASDANATGI
jgi:AraC-like DNA-binding protein